MIVAAALAVLCLAPAFDEDDDAPEVIIGARLFLETRFSQYFQAHANGGINGELPAGDPVVARSTAPGEDLPGPFAGRAMNCRTCHLVNEQQDRRGGGVRAYTDFARRSPVPRRDDGQAVTPRRSPILVNSTLPRTGPMLLHYDGEFVSIDDLVRGTLTGRNFGWLPSESALARRHIAEVIRKDDGSDLFARKTAALPYAVLLQGTDPRLAPYVRLPQAYRIDVARASDGELLDAVARLIGIYVNSLVFAAFKPAHGALFVGSPYDVFLVKNRLPRTPDPGESELAYARRLRERLASLSDPAWVSPGDGAFKLHAQPFQFGPRQLDGLRIFLAEPPGAGPRPSGRAGNCLACHAPPAFTDFAFHNTGACQEEYDAIHGGGAFMALYIPTLKDRNTTPDLYLPATGGRPGGLGMYRSAPSAARPGETDLGLWNVFANDAVPAPQSALRKILKALDPPTESDLSRSVALFKTPTLRDLGQAGPYFHTGRMDALSEVLRHYRRFADLAREGRVRNGDAALKDILLGESDLDALLSFLRSLNEDYND